MIVMIYIILGFFLGSIPFGLFVGKIWLGTDVRQQGSGNIGMTNVMRIGGKGPGVLTFVLDFLKGWLAVFLAASALNPEETQTQYTIIFLSAVAFSAVCGHIFSIFLHFKGGKGVSTLFGSLAALYFEIALICAIIWVLMFLLKKISSLSALTMLIIMPWLFLLMPWLKEVPFSGYQFIIMIALSGLMIYKHHENIVRLLKGKEGKLKVEESSGEK
ncbi:MAG: glycerol-3-phosphate 1-O-acyltransferase PlsY [SAR324 cluster bacterium]|nr:glycerol-3-phosphate 1-O-acyltransferase PlsY [SAR324 cluster bacterium]